METSGQRWPGGVVTGWPDRPTLGQQFRWVLSAAWTVLGTNGASTQACPLTLGLPLPRKPVTAVSLSGSSRNKSPLTFS